MRITMKYVAAIVLIAGTLLGISASAQETTARRVADLNPGDVGSFPSNFIAFNGSLYFSAYNFDLGRELWRYDGTAVTLVSNINDNTSISEEGLVEGHSSAPTSFAVFNGALCFAAFDERRGGELWRYDGTRAVRAADINPDMNDTIKLFPRNSWPYELTVMNNVLYFGADGGGIFFPNYELWRYDGVRASIVTNIHADFETNHSSYPHGLTVFNNALYFAADDGINGYELWKYNGTRALLLTNINPGGPSSGSFPKRFTPFNGALYFQAFDDLHGFEMWRTDGTNTTLVADINSNGGSFADFFTVFKGALYFGADDGTNGFELWRYNGVSPQRMADINPVGDSSVKNLTVFGEYLFFAANDGVHGWELWKCDGNSVSLSGDFNPEGDSFPEQLVVWNDHLFFAASNSLSGYEMWMFEGSSARLAADIFRGRPSSFPLWPAGLGSELLFSANDGYFSDWELWSLRINPFRIERIEQVGAEVRLTWRAKGGTTNIVQYADSLGGQFSDLSEPLHIDGTSEVSVSYSDVRSNAPGAARFYRIIQP